MYKKLGIVTTFLICFLSITFTYPVKAATINLDSDFNGIGYLSQNGAAGGNGNDRANSIVIESDGKYVITGLSVNLSGNQDMIIWRYNVNGTLDTTFNGVGYVSHNGAAGGNGNDGGYDLIIEPSGKYVVVGVSTSVSGTFDMTIWRYNPNGILDTTFNGVGYVSHNGAAGGNNSDAAYSVAIDASGRYVVTGFSINNTGNQNMTIWRYNANGTLDTTFNGVGYVCHNEVSGESGKSNGYSLAIDTNGKYIVSGFSLKTGVDYEMAVWRVNEDGALDTTFNGPGYATNNSAAGGNGIDVGYSVAVDINGKYVIGGFSVNAANNSDVTVWRYNTDGILDSSFNNTGIYTHGFSTKGDLADSINGWSHSLIIDKNNKIVLMGIAKIANTTNDFLLVRLNPNGSLDTTLNGTGYVYHALSSSNDSPAEVASDGKGKYVSAGYIWNANQDMALWVVLDYPHTLLLEETPLSFATNAVDIWGNVSAPKSTTKIGNVSWSLTGTGNWSNCTALDGAFDSLSENFTCNVNGLSDGTHSVYVRSCDEFASCTYKANIAHTTNFTVDTIAPTAKITNIGQISNIPDKTPLFYYFTSETPHIKGNAEASSTVHFRYLDNDYTTLTDSSGHFDITLPELPRTRNELTYYAVDQAGNRGSDRKLTLVIGEENFPEVAGAALPEITAIPVLPEQGTPTPTPTQLVYKFTLLNENRQPMPNTTVQIEGKTYKSDDKGIVYLEVKPVDKTLVKIGKKNEKGYILGETIILGESSMVLDLPLPPDPIDWSTRCMWPISLVILIIVGIIIVRKVLSRKE